MYPWNHASQIAIDLAKAIVVFARASWYVISDCKGRKRRYLARKGLQIVASYQRHGMLQDLRSRDRVYVDIKKGDFLVLSAKHPLDKKTRKQYHRRDVYVYRPPER